jgi:F-type H+-transporting ATPase subunit a
MKPAPRSPAPHAMPPTRRGVALAAAVLAAALPVTGAAADPVDHVVQHPIATVEADLGFLTPNCLVTVMSDHISMLILGGLLLMLLLPPLVRRRRGGDEVGRLVPAGPANLVEAVCQFLREQVAEPSLHEHTDRFIKFIWTVFFFVLTVNLLGLLPIAPISGLFGAHIGGTATGNIWVTGTLALITLGMIVVNGLRLGGLKWLAHFCPGPLWLAPLLVPLEIVGLFAKGFALAVRLFANMIAGHILLAVLVGFILSAGASSWLAGLGLAALAVIPGSIFVTLLEVFVAMLQAFIFTFLTALFIGQAVVFHHGGHEGAEAHA